MVERPRMETALKMREAERFKDSLGDAWFSVNPVKIAVSAKAIFRGGYTFHSDIFQTGQLRIL